MCTARAQGCRAFPRPQGGVEMKGARPQQASSWLLSTAHAGMPRAGRRPDSQASAESKWARLMQSEPSPDWGTPQPQPIPCIQ